MKQTTRGQHPYPDQLRAQRGMQVVAWLQQQK